MESNTGTTNGSGRVVAPNTREQSDISLSPQFTVESVGFGEPPPAYTEHQSELNEVITEEPPQYHDLFPPEVSIEESSENLAIVEQAFTSAHFKEASGFSLKYSCVPCCPGLTIYPTLSQLPLLNVRPEGWKITGQPSDPCHCCCCFPPIPIGGRKWQTMSLKQNEEEILSFVYSPKICCCGGRKDRMVDIYIPQRNQRIAVLRQGNTFKDGLVLVDYVTKSIFIVKNLDVRNSEAFAMTVSIRSRGSQFSSLLHLVIMKTAHIFCIQVISHYGIPVAVAQPTRGWRSRGFTTWTHFDLKFNTNVPQDLLSVSSKAVVMVAFAMWTMNYREDALINRWRWMALGIIIGIIIFGVIFIFTNN